MKNISGYLPNLLTTQNDEGSNVEKKDELTPEEYNSDCGQGTFNWLSDLYTNRNELWKKMKEDLTEVACVAKTEPRQALEKLTSAMHSVDNESTETHKDERDYHIDLNGVMHHIGVGLSSLGSIGNSYLKTYFMPPTQDDVGEEILELDNLSLSETEQTQTSLDVKIQILRADPRTYLFLPKPMEGVCSYEDWFNVYFDENICQPRPGVPLPSDLTTSDCDNKSNTSLASIHPSPAEILEKCPSVKTHLQRLVNPELGLRRSSDIKVHGLSEVDFWSRYYYRVYYLEIIEARRKKIANLVSRMNKKTDGIGSFKESEQKSYSNQWDSSSAEEDDDVEVNKSKGNPSSSEETPLSTPEFLTVKSDSPVLLSDEGVIREDESKSRESLPDSDTEGVDDKNKTPSLMPKTENQITKMEEKLDNNEEDDWENWS